MSRPRTAIVIGGGIAGPVTAIALRKAGIEATVFEARPPGTQHNGVMLTLATNGIDALRAIGAEAAALEIGFATPGITLRTHTGKRLGVTPTGSTRPGSTGSRTIRRSDLYRAIHAQAADRGITIEGGRRLVAADDGPEGVCAVFDDGSTAEADILIGADGVHSTVRTLIDPGAPRPAYTGLITTGGYAPATGTATVGGDYEMIFGKRAFFGYATAPDGENWWFVNLPHRPEPGRGEVEAVPGAQWRRTFTQIYRDDAGPALELISATPDFAPMTAIHTVPKLPHWHRGRMIVVGDAAHAPSPTSGQGASLSIEDAVVLALSLRDNDSVSAAFAGFESVRRPRVERIIKAAARINNSKAPGPAGRFLRDLTLPTILRMTADSASNRRVFDHQLDWADDHRTRSGPR
ncbi:FAD-dependent monooxygenase [Nakamurella lactea]|uniref:FAD-dependent monooxygenase n=1 Tax=Nakamurella lactea TaxID=459515 RepID=UPI00040AA626|nr:FAD-dependent monooxygenase [Nakamurella lactea]